MKDRLGDHQEAGNLLLGGPGANREGGAGRVTGGGSVLRKASSFRATSVLSLGGRRGGSYSPGDGGGRGYDREK